MNKIITDILNTLAQHGISELPYYACNYIGERKVRCIENGKIECNGKVSEKDLVYFKYCLEKELAEGFMVSFDWDNDSIRKNVILLPCTNFSGCFDTKGTWMHLKYDTKDKTYLAYCNVVWNEDSYRTLTKMKNIKTINFVMFNY